MQVSTCRVCLRLNTDGGWHCAPAFYSQLLWSCHGGTFSFLVEPFLFSLPLAASCLLSLSYSLLNCDSKISIISFPFFTFFTVILALTSMWPQAFLWVEAKAPHSNKKTEIFLIPSSQNAPFEIIWEKNEVFGFLKLVQLSKLSESQLSISRVSYFG